EIANVAKIFGFFMTIFGAALGGIFVTRYGVEKPLISGSVMIIITNLLFVWLARTEPNISTLAVVISADNLSGGFATSAFIAYLSSMTNKAYSATQYALFSSLMTLPAKFIGGFSGIVVDAAGYAYFFLYAGLLGIPALLLIIYILYHDDSVSLQK
ncbi:MAG: MFS transporter, partial [Gammaproteobacteria bacterium]|nr:MFS transporter [Gammaproteobacteria bacterium]